MYVAGSFASVKGRFFFSLPFLLSPFPLFISFSISFPHMSWHLAYFPSPPWSFSLLHFVPFGFDPVPLCIFHSSDHFPSFFVLPSFSFLLLPLVPCISYFFSSSLLQGLLSTFPYLGSSALVPICFSFNLSSHHTFHVSFTTARMSTSASCAGWSWLLSSVRPLPTSLPIHPPWPRVDSPLACLPCSLFSTSSPLSPLPSLYLRTRLFLSASFLPLLISFTDSYVFIAPLHLQDPSISRFLSPS